MIMAWVAVGGDGSECMFASKPSRIKICKSWAVDNDKYLNLPKGTIKKLIERKLTWEVFCRYYFYNDSSKFYRHLY